MRSVVYDGLVRVLSFSFTATVAHAHCVTIQLGRAYFSPGLSDSDAP
uniref:Uncharacterized protein n=1 Tax=Anguilla anguilla TaxID=7936 RepID=A0A0E9S354_ANGAN